MTAITLHEIGHVFTYYEYSNRVSSTNQILAQFAYDNHNNKMTPDKVTYTFKEIGSKFQLSEKEIKELELNIDSSILGPKLFKVYLRNVDSLRKVMKYDETSSETLADNFAVRQGYGKDLVTGLEKLTDYYPVKNTTILFILYNIEFWVDFVLVPSVIISALSTAAPLGIFLAFFVTVLFYEGSKVENKNMTYDELKQRYNRIKLTMIERLKDKNLDVKTTKELIENVETIDKIMDGILSNADPIKMKLMNFILPSNITINKDIDRQQKIEELAFNRLFISAAKMRVDS